MAVIAMDHGCSERSGVEKKCDQESYNRPGETEADESLW